MFSFFYCEAVLTVNRMRYLQDLTANHLTKLYNSILNKYQQHNARIFKTYKDLDRISTYQSYYNNIN